MDDQPKPHVHGTRFVGPPVDANGRIPKYELKTGAAGLTDLTGEYTFFTPAILYVHGNFQDGPLIDFMYDLNVEVKFYYKQFRKPLFRGLEARTNGDPAWNFALWAVRSEYFQALNDFLVSVTLTYRDDHTVAGVGEQLVSIPDPLRVDRTVLYDPAIPHVPVTVFGINGSRYRAALETSDRPFAAPPTLRFYAPDEAMVTFAKALYCGVNPIDARSAHQRKRGERNEGHPGSAAGEDRLGGQRR